MSDILNQIAVPLTRWYEQNKRPLPWRESKDPYAVWVSEIMLQQTRIEAVVERYSVFMKELPSLAALAAVEEQRLLKLWEGMGYYSRAKNLKKAAVVIQEEYGGVFPREAALLRRLPGIGEYTAGAIASICFNQKVPAVDGNVLRVLARLLADESNVLEPQTKKRAAAALEAVMPENAGAFNEGLMELGETVCLANAPALCEKCPLQSLCLAFKQNRVSALPVRKKQNKRKEEKRTVLILKNKQGKVAIEKRPAQGLLAGLYQLPNTSGFLNEKQVEKIIAKEGFSVKSVRPLGQCKHIFTHLLWQMLCFEVQIGEEEGLYTWCSEEELRERFALPTAFSKCLKKAL